LRSYLEDEGADSGQSVRSRRPTVEDVPDEGDPLPEGDGQQPVEILTWDEAWTQYVEEFDAAYEAGAVFRDSKTPFENIRDAQNKAGQSRWADFADEEEWEFAKFIMETLGHTEMEKLLRLPLVSPAFTASS
jgi:hypothetical protein